MLKRFMAGLCIVSMALTMAGCGKENQILQDNTPQQEETANQEARKYYLTPLSEGTPLNAAAPELRAQIAAQKDVLGVKTYEKQDGVFYGEIMLANGVNKIYAHDLAADFLDQLKAADPNRAIITLAVNEKKEVLEELSYTPEKNLDGTSAET